MLKNEIENIKEEVRGGDKVDIVDKLEDKLIGKKKFRLENLIEAASSNKLNSLRNPLTKNNSEDESDAESDKEMEKYKNLISGKINLKNVFNNLKEDSRENNKTKLENLSTNMNKNIHPESKNISQNISQKLLNLLPAPKKKISDNILNTNFSKKKINPQNFFQIGDKFRELANPDSEIVHSDSTSSMTIMNNFHSNMNTYSINVNDQVDKNWELKYMRNLEVEEEAEREQHAVPTREQTSKNHIKALISDHNKSKAIKQSEHEATNSKYGKISTKNKYGW